MARRGRPPKQGTGAASSRGAVRVDWDPGNANPKQREFFESRALYTAYGGAKGGGKTWAVRVKAVGGALTNPGIRILIMRRTYPELEENHIRPIVAMVPQVAASYNGSMRLMTFYNGSIIKFGHWSGELSEQEYQGLEFDWIFIDEATQFTERAFRYLCGCLRGVNRIPKRMYLTCNPGGVGHSWVKRLFIERDFKTDSEDPEKNENPEDYKFIPATVDDNPYLIQSSPGYLQMLANMPNYEAYRYGNWDLVSGAYFKEFRRDTHVIPAFKVPAHWPRFRALDYGLDMLACYWVAVDEQGRAYIYREFCKSDLIVQDAAQNILTRTLPGENVQITFAPPDLWSRQKDSGRTMAELFMLNGVSLVRADNNRVQGHMLIKDALAIWPDGKPGLLVFDCCERLIKNLQEIQADENNPDDCAKEPHDVTHTVDALRYFCVSRTIRAEKEKHEEPEEEPGEEEYESYMTGGEAGTGYLNY